MKRRRALCAAVFLLAACLLASCSHGSSRSAHPAATSAPERTPVLVTIGSDATLGDGLADQVRLRDAWPQKLYHEAMPEAAVLVNASYDDGVTIDRAVALEVPLALDQHATVVAVWLGDADLADKVSAASFRAKLDGMVATLRKSGAKVLLGNLAPVNPDAVAYNDAIASVAKARGATFVDVAAALSETPGIGPSSKVTPTTSGKIAAAFAVALARS
jgi:GDSL-like Lipase/Acylhydrolase family